MHGELTENNMQTPSGIKTSSSKLKYLIILAFIFLLGFTVYKMMLFEDSIREQRIIKINVGGEKKKLIPLISSAELQKRADESAVLFKAGKKYISVQETKIVNGENVREWKNHFLKGVNMGVALPGSYPTEFNSTYEMYLEWFKKIAEMNSNTIRTYTILPPEFYGAFAQYNTENSNKPLYLLQGVWADETDSNNYFETAYKDRFQNEIKEVLDVIHGNAVIPELRGHASGVYARDVSRYTIGILLGREWEPLTVTVTNKMNSLRKSYNGNFISLPEGNAMEAWLAEMMDFTVHYETQIYGNQRPVSFVNWLPTDPMYHSSEFIENKKVREYDNDIESIDFRKFNVTNLFKAGIFASYHAYPYYPDFIYLDKKYQTTLNAAGKQDGYFSYLKELRTFTPDMPLLITEYGVPSSRGNSHFTPSGMNQGGHSEADQAEINRTLTEDIFNSGCGGAVYFEWMDEWFKFNWLVMDFEVPANRRKLWHNLENPEQNFGVLAVEQRSKKLDGNEDDWNEKDVISAKGNYRLSAGSDAEYFYMKYNLPDFDFYKNSLHIAIDTYDKIKGDHKLSFTDESPDRGIEFLIDIQNKDSGEILVDDRYSVYSDIYNDYLPVYASKENYDGKFVRQILLSNRERESLEGNKTDRLVYDRSSLIPGRSDETETSNSNLYWNEKDKILEIRLPWHLLNVSDPSSKSVLNDIEGTGDVESIETDGFNIYSYITDKQDKNAVQIPENRSGFYTWEKWEKPQYKFRNKKSFYMFQNLFHELDAGNTEEDDDPVVQGFKMTDWFENKKGAVSISFDDASMTQITEGVPVLEKYGMTATYAVVTEWMDENPSLSAETGNFAIEKFGWKQARELLEKGNEIASHNFSHIKLDTIPEDRVLEMMKQSKLITEKNIHQPVFTFVFPYSSTKPFLFPLTQKAGYLFARTGTDQTNIKNTLDFTRLATIAIYNDNNPTIQQLEDIVNLNEDKWLILNYHHIFPDSSKEMNLLRYHNVTNTYSVTPATFEKQVRILRNSDHWIAPISYVGRYIMQKEGSELKITNLGDKIFVKIENNLDMSIYNIPMTIEYTTDWNIVKISNSANDGFYNPRNNKIYFTVIPGQEVLLENKTNE